jgi:two-component system, chemotaxis family, sensor kinase CheA
MENQQYLQAFLDESAENTQMLNTLCLELEQGRKDDDVFAAMFRAAHTLKGMSATMGFTEMAKLTHRLEDALGLIRKDPELLTSDVVDRLFACIDGLTDNLEEIRSSGSEDETDHEELILQLQALLSDKPVKIVNSESSFSKQVHRSDLELNENTIAVVRECHGSGIPTGIAKVTVDPKCVMKGVRAIVITRTIDQFADCLQCSPDATAMEEGAYESELQFVVAVQNGTSAQLVFALQNISEVLDATYTEIDLDIVGKAPAKGEEKPKKKATNQTHQKAHEQTEKVDRTIRVSVDRLDTLLNQLSELVLDKTRLNSVAVTLESKDLKDVSEHISRIATDIQSSVMSLRMVPVESLFQRFPRLVRDLSKSLNKKIKLEMSGLTTELDRTVIDEMGEALVHLIRNAADHGLESTETRIKNGKPEEGTIFLRAYASGQHVFIEVAEDGGGIDAERILQRAIKNGLVTPDRAAQLTESQIISFLFASGFSTADKVSDISGRGVGLDAVKRKVESLGGRIDVNTVLGQGTTFQIELPLTLAILQSLLVGIDSEIFAIPLASVEEVLEADDAVLERVHGTMTLNLRGKLVPIIDASKWLFGVPACTEMPWRLVVCKEGTKRIALAVNSYNGQQEVVNKSLGGFLSNVREFSGATILGDGKIALIFNIHEWMSF